MYACRASPFAAVSPWPAPKSPPLSTVNDNLTSPLLTALGASSTAVKVAHSTKEWAAQVPFGNPLEEHEEKITEAASPHGASPPRGDDLRGGFSNVSPSVSPRAAYRLPARRNNAYQSFGDYLGSSPGRDIPPPTHAHYSQSPPLPHHPQPHFYGAPDPDFMMTQARGEERTPSREGCCVFDSLASAGDAAVSLAENVLLLGSERSLEVYRVEKNKCSLLGRLEGLRGTVLDAKILPCTLKKDPLQTLRPLVAVVVHGPLQDHEPNEKSQREESRPKTSNSNDPEFDPSSSMLEAIYSTNPTPSQPFTSQPPTLQPTMCYQTGVEIYSLSNRKHVATLLKSPIAKADAPYRNHSLTAPPPIGNLSVQAKGRFIIVSSGDSGEVYIFEVTQNKKEDATEAFRCVGKTWTSIPVRKSRSWSSSSTSSEVESTQDASPARAVQHETPMVSLSHRWLAIVPPIPSSRSTIHATALLTAGQKPPGLTSHTGQSQPQVTCELDIPARDSVLDKMARDATQGVIRGARWISDQGMHAFKNYWYKPTETDSQLSMYQNGLPMAQQPQQNFPPTHAHDNQTNRANNQPILVSILDLEKLSNSQETKTAVALQPVSTFGLPDGCSFVSFAPNGLSLLTASAKGDVQHVWDLMRMVHGTSGPGNSIEGSSINRGVVRQVAQFTRLTVATIIDIAWTEPRGERLAIVTDRGTVHIYDLPASAFQWPPSRRVARTTTGSGVLNEASSEPGTPAISAPNTSTYSTAMSMVSGTTQPFLAVVRGRPSSIANPFTGFGGLNLTAGAGTKGTKVVAAGISKSVGAATGTVNTLRHIGENRLHIPGFSRVITAGCIRWLSGKDRGLIAIVGGGILRLHNVRQSINANPGKRRPSVLGDRPIELSIPDARGHVLPRPTRQRPLSQEETPLVGSHWPTANTALQPHRPGRGETHPLSFAEIETNAPYQPFHTDRRINLHVYASTNEIDIHHLHDRSPWAFGEDIPTVQISAGSTDSDEHEGMDALTSQMENIVRLEGHTDHGQQVVVTTRRRRGKKGESDGQEEDFFEDDCEVVDFATERV